MFSKPLQTGAHVITSDDRPQFCVRSGTASLMISIDGGRAVVSGSDLTLRKAHIDTLTAGTLATRDMTLTQKTSLYENPLVDFARAGDVHSVIVLRGGLIGNTEPYTLVLPTAQDIIDAGAAIGGEALTINIVNDSSVPVNIEAAGIPVDTITPRDCAGSIVVQAGTTVLVTALICVCIVPRVDYRCGASRHDNPAMYTLVPRADSLPAVGCDKLLYCIEDTNAIVRYGTTAVGYDWIVGTNPCDDFSSIADALASPFVIAGHKIRVRAGTYTITSTLIVNKSVGIFGESRATTIIRTRGTSTDPSQMVRIAADNVSICNMTIAHYRAVVGSSVVMIAANDPFSGFILDNCHCEYVEDCCTINSSGEWKINACTFRYRGPVSNTFRTFRIIGTAGNLFIMGCVFDYNGHTTGTSRCINVTTGATCNGLIIFDGNTQIGRLSQIMYFQDYTSAGDNSLAIILRSNIFDELEAAVRFATLTANFGNTLLHLSACNNVLSNTHGSGIFSAYGSSTPISFRSIGALPVHIFANTLARAGYLGSGWSRAIGSTADSFNYRTTRFSVPVSVLQDDILEPIPDPPVTPSDSDISTGYIRLGPDVHYMRELITLGAGDLVSITLAGLARANSLIVFRNRAVMYETEEYTLAIAGGRTQIIWEPTHPVIAGDRILCQYSD